MQSLSWGFAQNHEIGWKADRFCTRQAKIMSLRMFFQTCARTLQGWVWGCLTFSPMKRSNHWLKCIVLGVCSLNLILAQAWPNCWSCWHHTHLDCTFWYILQIEVHKLWSSDVEDWNILKQNQPAYCVLLLWKGSRRWDFRGWIGFQVLRLGSHQHQRCMELPLKVSVGCIFQEPLTQSRTVFSMRFTEIHRNSSKRK